LTLVFAAPTLVAPQWRLIVIFGVLLASAIGTIAWMARQLAVGAPRSMS
jgi:hypothetical protein